MSDLRYYNPAWIEPTDEVVRCDVCVYGASAAGVMAALAAADEGLAVQLVQPGGHIGGMTTGGLGWTDFGNKDAVGGAARRFYQALGTHYGKAEEWNFEPSAAQTILDRELRLSGITPRLFQYVDRVDVENGRIVAARMLGGLTIEARVFIDASYEGDLMAIAGVPYHVGRESNDQYGETLNGIQVRSPDDHNGDHHQFDSPVSPYRIDGDPASGLLPGIEDDDLTRRRGQGDHRVQAYNFRICMTDDPGLRIDWQAPDDYDPADYVLLDRWLRLEKSAFNEQVPAQDGDLTRVRKFDKLPNRTPGGYWKTDSNNHGPVSSDFIGGSHRWPEASHFERESIFQAHVRWQQGLYYHIANADGIPDKYRRAYRRWGLSRDEFAETNGWPHQLYVREARRMVGSHVVTEHDCLHRVRTRHSIGLASYTMDSHHTCRFVRGEGVSARVMNEGNVEVPPSEPFGIDYGCVVPPRNSISNLLVPVCLSASHIAYGSVRMEPVFMILGQSVGIAASLAIRDACDVQDVAYPMLKSRLLDAGQRLGAAATTGTSKRGTDNSPVDIKGGFRRATPRPAHRRSRVAAGEARSSD
ncbi:MAG: FAD-dependent oxidoreductase [Planctomycetota bacterium]